MSFSTNTINPKPCIYGCGTRIYWNTSGNAYFEVFVKNNHQCPNLQQQNNTNQNYIKKAISLSSSSPSQIIPNKRIYYNKFTKQPKQEMSNSFELLQGSVADIQKKYEILSDIVSDIGGKNHGSQRDRDPKTELMDLIVYYEVLEGKKEEVKQRFKNDILTINSS